MMRHVNSDDLACGMELAEDVVCKNGRLLLSRGTVLVPGHLRVLRIWGVPAVSVVDGPAGEPHGDRQPVGEGGSEEDIPEEIRRALHARFVLTDYERNRQGLAAELYRFCLRGCAAPDRRSSPVCVAAPEAGGGLPPAPESPEAVLTGDPSLASFPDIYFRLQEAISDPRASAGHIADIVGADPGLAASLLRLANSPFYGLPRPIDSLARGVMMIGAGELAQLALGVAVVSRFKDVPNGCLTMRQAWEYAVGCGVLARVLASHVGGLVQETLFVAGLLHDLGRLVLLRRAPRHMARAMTLATAEGMPLCAAERQVLGFTHAAVGEALLARWRLPGQLARAVGGHHGEGAASLEAAIVHMADAAAVAVGFGCNGSPLVPPVNAWAEEALGLGPGVLTLALSQAGRQVDDIVTILLAA